MTSVPTEAASSAREAGWLAVPDLLSAEEIASLLDRFNELLRAPSAEKRAGDKVASGTRHLNELDERVALVADIVHRPRLVDCVHVFMQDGPPALDQVSYRSPQPGFGAQRLHADAPPLTRPGPVAVVTAIVALVDFTERNGATRLIPGSHDRPDMQRQAGSLASHDEAVFLTGLAGTAFVFNGHVLHSGTQNDSSAERPALQLVWRRGPAA